MMNKKGFTLLEVMIAMVILSILATIAFNAYHGQVRKGRRVEAIQTLTAMQLAQEKYRMTNTSYGALNDVWSATATENGLYNLQISGVTATGYTLTAVAQGDQANDVHNGTACSTLTLAVTNTVISKTPSGCW